MGLFSGIAKLPLAPVRGVMSLGAVIQRQADRELRNPARTRRKLEELEEARDRGEISPDEENQAQEQILETRVKPGTPGTPPSEEG